MARPTIKKDIREAKQAFMEVMQANLSGMADKLIDRIMKSYAKATPANKINAANGLSITGLSLYKGELLAGMALVASEALKKARLEVPTKSKAKLSDWDEEAVKLGEFDKLPSGMKKRLKNQASIVTKTQSNDLEKVILLQFSSSVESTDSERLLRSDIEGAAQDYILGPSIYAGSGVVAGKVINESRQAFFWEPEVLDALDAFEFVNDVPETDICIDLNGTVFAKDDPNAFRYTPPLHYNCWNKSTMIFTEDGWRDFSIDLIGKKAWSIDPITKQLSLVPIVGFVKRKHKGEMIRMTNPQRSLDMSVTPGHTMFYYKRVDTGNGGKQVRPFFESVDKFIGAGEEGRINLVANWKGQNIDQIVINGKTMSMAHYCEFMGYYLADGTTLRYGISIGQIDHKDRMFDSISKMGMRHISKTKRGIYVGDKAIVDHTRTFGKSPERFVPEIIKSLSPVYLRIFLDAFRSCDGYEQPSNNFKGGKFEKMKRYFTTSSRLFNDLCEIIIKTGSGITTSMTNVKGKEHQFRNGKYIINHDMLNIGEVTSTFRRAKEIIREPYDDFVYDVELERNHTILVKYNGKVSWGSNCDSYILPILAGKLGKREITPLSPSDPALEKDIQFSSKKNKHLCLSCGRLDLSED